MKLKQYPEYELFRSGIKVSWYFYDTREEAEKASKIAVHNARILEAQGYDWGYQCPGEIKEVKPGGWYGDKTGFEVTIP